MKFAVEVTFKDNCAEIKFCTQLLEVGCNPFTRTLSLSFTIPEDEKELFVALYKAVDKSIPYIWEDEFGSQILVHDEFVCLCGSMFELNGIPRNAIIESLNVVCELINAVWQ